MSYPFLNLRISLPALEVHDVPVHLEHSKVSFSRTPRSPEKCRSYVFGLLPPSFSEFLRKAPDWHPKDFVLL